MRFDYIYNDITYDVHVFSWGHNNEISWCEFDLYWCGMIIDYDRYQFIYDDLYYEILDECIKRSKYEKCL